MFKQKVVNKYLAIKGIVDDVGGKIFETNNKKTTKANRILIASVIFSSASAGR